MRSCSSTLFTDFGDQSNCLVPMLALLLDRLLELGLVDLTDEISCRNQRSTMDFVRRSFLTAACRWILTIEQLFEKAFNNIVRVHAGEIGRDAR